MNDMIKHNGIVAMVEGYNEILKESLAAIAMLEKNEARLKSFCGKYSYLTGSCTNRIPADYEIKKALKIKFWSSFVEKSQVKTLMSSAKVKEFDRMLEEKTPEFTVQNAMETLKHWSGSAMTMLEDTVKAGYRHMQPYRSKLKTNQRAGLGKKVILNGMVEITKYSKRMSYYREDILDDIDNAFHLLDGKGTAKYPKNLNSQINDAMRKDEFNLETDYFSIKWYRGGSLHLKFKRLDLVKRMDQMCGGNALCENK